MVDNTIYPYRTEEEHTNSLASYYPDGDLFCAKWIEGTNLRGTIKGLSPTYKRAYDLLNEISIELDPHKTDKLIPEWEAALGIPDDCFITVDDLTKEERRIQILAKLYGFGVSTAPDFERLGEIFGFDIKVVSGVDAASFPYIFPIQFVSPKTARFTITVIVNIDEDQDNGFPYTFPIQFGNVMLSRMQCFFRKLAPVNTIVEFVFGNDDIPWSQQDDLWQNINTTWSIWGLA